MQFIIEAAASRYLQLARDRNGCCVLQKCIEYSNNEQRNDLLSKITSSALRLSEDQYGYARYPSILTLFSSNYAFCVIHAIISGRNYVIQFIIGLKIEWATARVVEGLEGHIGHLSMQKSGSHVVEYCIMQAPQLMSDRIVNELKNDPRLLEIIIHEFGNYVIQTVLRHSQVKMTSPSAKRIPYAILTRRLFNDAG